MSNGVTENLRYEKRLYIMKDIIEKENTESQQEEMGTKLYKKSQKSKQQSFKDKKKSIISKHIKDIIMLLAPSILSGIITLIGTVYNVNALTDRVDSIDGENGKIEKLENKIDNMESKLGKNMDKLESIISNNIDKVESRISNNIDKVESRITNDVKEAKEEFRTALGFIKCFPTDNGLSGMPDVNINIEIKANSNPNWTAMQTIAIDADTGEKYHAEELINKRILMPYTENGTEVYFFGQYNSKNHWDGDCTINVYENDKLILITDAVYKDGKLQKYKQALPSFNSSGDTVWIISNRICKGKVNQGVSVSYYVDKLPDKGFNIENVEIRNIISVREFQTSLKLGIEGYYSGNTSNGKYNDDTGEAYMAKYFHDGTIKMLYRGKFKNGTLYDTSNDSWYIVKEKDTDYMYYKGPFENNTSKWKDDKYFKNHLTLDEITEFIKDYDFDCSLKWNFNETN